MAGLVRKVIKLTKYIDHYFSLTWRSVWNTNSLDGGCRKAGWDHWSPESNQVKSQESEVTHTKTKCTYKSKY